MTARFALLEEMRSAAEVARGFDVGAAQGVLEAAARRKGRLLIVGEGSSRIFPAKRGIALARRRGLALEVATEGARQAAGYPLERWAVLALSRSGKTREVVDLCAALRAQGHDALFEAGRDDERGFPSTRSVVREALFVEACLDPEGLAARLPAVADGIAAALAAKDDEGLVSDLASARHVHFSGPNDGVAEELALKCAEIARTPSSFFEGSFVLHGAHATLRPGDVVVLDAPPPEDAARMRERIEKAGALAAALPAAPGADAFGRLAAGWRLLAAVGLARRVDLDGADLRV